MTSRAGGAAEDEAVKYTTHDGGSGASIWQGNVPTERLVRDDQLVLLCTSATTTHTISSEVKCEVK
eukprot:scaffold84373_cov52-Phaeocystis_antarctica.AAC.1